MPWGTIYVCIRELLPSQRRSRRLWQILVAALVLGVSLAPWPASAQLFREVVVFGDSLSDIGNILAATGDIPVSPPYDAGRFSNGKVWVEHLAEMWDLTLTRSPGGLNFAYGGAEIGTDNSDFLERDIGVVIPSLRNQVETFLISQNFDDVDPVTLYVVWGGANDIRDALVTEVDPFREAQGAIGELDKIIRDLIDADAVYFLVPNLPDLGLIPENRARGTAAMARATAVSVAFNQALTLALNAIEAEHHVVIARLDTFTRLREVSNNPADFDLTNVTEACLPGDPFDAAGEACSDPELHLFWDQIHPSAAGHVLLAKFAAAVLPPVVATRGNDSPEETARVTLPAQNLPVLQVRLGTGEDPGRLRRVTIDFVESGEQASLVKNLRVHLIHDANENGRRDAGEIVLATRETRWPVGTLTLQLAAPFDIPSTATAHLLVTLDINSETTSAVAVREATLLPISQDAGSSLGWLALLLPGLALAGLPRLQGSARRNTRVVCIFLVCCSIMLVSCNSAEDVADDISDIGDGANAFTVTIPARGMAIQGGMSGSHTLPPVSITGAKVRVES